MSDDRVYAAVKGLFAERWTATPPDLISWENKHFDLPQSDDPYIAVEVTGNYYGQESIGAETQGANRWDAEGQLWVHVFVRTGTGSEEARRLAKIAADLFRGTQLLDGDLTFGDAAIGMGAPGDNDGLYWQLSVSVEWGMVEA